MDAGAVCCVAACRGACGGACVAAEGRAMLVSTGGATTTVVPRSFCFLGFFLPAVAQVFSGGGIGVTLMAAAGSSMSGSSAPAGSSATPWAAGGCSAAATSAARRRTHCQYHTWPDGGAAQHGGGSGAVEEAGSTRDAQLVPLWRGANRITAVGASWVGVMGAARCGTVESISMAPKVTTHSTGQHHLRGFSYVVHAPAKTNERTRLLFHVLSSLRRQAARTRATHHLSCVTFQSHPLVWLCIRCTTTGNLSQVIMPVYRVQ
jgi:hypothetical protein